MVLHHSFFMKYNYTPTRACEEVLSTSAVYQKVWRTL